MAAASVARSQDVTRAHRAQQAAALRMAAASATRSQGAARAHGARQAAAKYMANEKEAAFKISSERRPLVLVQSKGTKVKTQLKRYGNNNAALGFWCHGK